MEGFDRGPRAHREGAAPLRGREVFLRDRRRQRGVDVLQDRHQHAHRGRAAVRVLLEAAHDHRREGEGDARDAVLQRDREIVGHRDGERSDARPLERQRPAEQLIEHHPEGPHIRARGEVARVAKLLRRHVGGRAQRDVRRGDPWVVVEVLGDHREAEIQQPRRPADAVADEEDVLWFQVTVHHPGVVQYGQGVEHREHERDEIARRHRTAAVLRVRREVDAVEVLLHQVRRAPLVDAEVFDPHDVGVTHERGRLALAQHPPRVHRA